MRFKKIKIQDLEVGDIVKARDGSEIYVIQEVKYFCKCECRKKKFYITYLDQSVSKWLYVDEAEVNQDWRWTLRLL